MKTSTPNTLRLYLIRHGETEWSLSGRHTGRTDLPLTVNGEDEARELGKHLQNFPFAHVLASPLEHALQTSKSQQAGRLCAQPHRTNLDLDLHLHFVKPHRRQHSVHCCRDRMARNEK